MVSLSRAAVSISGGAKVHEDPQEHRHGLLGTRCVERALIGTLRQQRVTDEALGRLSPFLGLGGGFMERDRTSSNEGKNAARVWWTSLGMDIRRTGTLWFYSLYRISHADWIDGADPWNHEVSFGISYRIW